MNVCSDHLASASVALTTAHAATKRAGTPEIKKRNRVLFANTVNMKKGHKKKITPKTVLPVNCF